MSPTRLRSIIGGGLLAVVLLMPFHAFLSVFGGHLTGHEQIIQAWKEVLLLLLGLLGVVLAVIDPASRDRLRSAPILFAGLFVLVAMLVTLIFRPQTTAIVFGAKTDLEFLAAFVLGVIASTPRLTSYFSRAILITSGFVILFALLEVFVLPKSFLTSFGYSTTTVAPYETLNAAGSILRFPSTLGGPNQLGTFLILPVALSFVVAVRRRMRLMYLYTFAGILAVFYTFSRAAWIGLLAAGATALLLVVGRRLRLKAAVGLSVATALFTGLLAGLSRFVPAVNRYLLHGGTTAGSSDELHLASLKLGLSDDLHQPLGHGLGTAGPAVFHSGSGIIIENYYLQLAYETGVLGLLVFVVFGTTTAIELARRSAKIPLAAACLAALVGISVTSLFLPSWTDSSTSLVFWTAAGAVIGCLPESRYV
jgi:hypothetical protein